MTPAGIHIRSKVLFAIRTYFIKNGFIEVETPNRLPTLIPEAHIDPVTSEGWFLHTSPEMCMKRLLSKGFENIFQITRCYRKEERGEKHLPEFSLLEWYEAHKDYTDLMIRCESLIPFIAHTLFEKKSITSGSNTIDLTPPWDRLSVEEAFRRYADITPETALDTDRYDEIMGLEIEPKLGKKKPLFLYDYPIRQGALARKREDAPHLAERFELYIDGLELCNAFTELTDAKEQRKRFEKELIYRKTHGKCPIPMPERFLTDLKNMPPAAGNALGIDRLVMLFADTRCIDDVAAFAMDRLE